MELSHTRGQATTASKSLLQVLRRHPLVFYFVLAYGMSWLIEWPLVLSHQPLPYMSLAGPLGPALAAFLMTALTEGKAGMGRLLRRYILWRVGILWYLFAILGIPAAQVLGSLLTPGFLASFHLHLAPIVFLIHYATVLFIGGLIGGPFLEEWGWRGFALPRMQRSQGPLMASLVLGVLWAFWHVPFFLPGYFGLNLPQIGEYVLGVTLFTIIITWVFNNTRGSLLLAFLVHASIDTAVHIFPAPLAASFFPAMIGFGVTALLLIVLTRGRLSHERDLREMVLPAPKAVVEQGPGAPGKSM